MHACVEKQAFHCFDYVILPVDFKLSSEPVLPCCQWCPNHQLSLNRNSNPFIVNDKFKMSRAK